MDVQLRGRWASGNIFLHREDPEIESHHSHSQIILSAMYSHNELNTLDAA